MVSIAEGNKFHFPDGERARAIFGAGAAASNDACSCGAATTESPKELDPFDELLGSTAATWERRHYPAHESRGRLNEALRTEHFAVMAVTTWSRRQFSRLTRILNGLEICGAITEVRRHVN